MSSRVLIIKTSSLGDIIHTLPAVTEAKKACPNIQFDWLVDESFQEIPAWHPAIHNVIPIPLRRLKKIGFRAWQRGEIQKMWGTLREHAYDLIIDAQGLFKSAFLACLCRGTRAGLSFSSAREPLASFFYQKKYIVPNYKKSHAILRAKYLFAKSLGYTASENIEYGLERIIVPHNAANITKPYCIFLHGTTWTSKLWPESYWRELSIRLFSLGFDIKLPWGNVLEYEAAKRIQGGEKHVEILPKLTLTELVPVLLNAKVVISVDTGLGHLSAALDVPTIALFGATDPKLNAPIGQYQKTLNAEFGCAPCLKRTCVYQGIKRIDPPCYASLSPLKVMQAIMHCIEHKKVSIGGSYVPKKM